MNTAARPASSTVFVGNQWKLSFAQLFSGVGIAVGFTVGSILAEQLTGRAEYGGFAQTASIMGAGLVAIPLARLAERRSRRYSLSLGFGIAFVGALTILIGVRLASPVIFFLGMLMFGASTATGLQARYAATDTAPKHLRGRALSIVVWATTIGSVAGPNLAGPGGAVGRFLNVGNLGGPFALSAVAFLVAVLFTLRLASGKPPGKSRAAGDVILRSPDDVVIGPNRQSADESFGASAPAATAPAATAPAASAPRARAPRASAPKASAAAAPRIEKPTLKASLAAMAAHPRALLGFAAVVLGHTVMVSVMVMTPIHMQHSGDTIEVIGIVISLHILGMYALSPVYGYLTDRFGAIPVIWTGFALLTAAALLGINDDLAGSAMPRISAALTLLGLGWSACFIAGSTLLTESIPAVHRVTIQGAADASMNFGAAIFAAAAGPLLTLGGFTLINIAALAIIAVGVAVAVRSLRAHSRATQSPQDTPR